LSIWIIISGKSKKIQEEWCETAKQCRFFHFDDLPANEPIFEFQLIGRHARESVQLAVPHQVTNSHGTG
jgi:hypothetical protein